MQAILLQMSWHNFILFYCLAIFLDFIMVCNDVYFVELMEREFDGFSSSFSLETDEELESYFRDSDVCHDCGKTQPFLQVLAPLFTLYLHVHVYTCNL